MTETLPPLPVGKSGLYMTTQKELAWELYRRTPTQQCAKHREREPGDAHVWGNAIDKSWICIPNPPIAVCPEHPDTAISVSKSRPWLPPRCPKAVCHYEGEGILR